MWRGDGRDGYWSTHPMLASIVSGVFLFLVGGFVFSSLLSWYDARRWREVARMSCHVLADRLTRGIVTTLAGLYGDRVEPVAPWKARTNWQVSDVDPLTEVYVIPEGKDRLAVFTAELPDDTPIDGDHLIDTARLRGLITDRAWSEFAIDHLRELRERGRLMVSQWAAVMIVADEPRALLNAVALLNEHVGYLRQSLERRLQQDDQDPELTAWIDDVVRRWQLVDARARILTNTLWAKADEGHFSSSSATAQSDTRRRLR